MSRPSGHLINMHVPLIYCLISITRNSVNYQPSACMCAIVSLFGINPRVMLSHDFVLIAWQLASVNMWTYYSTTKEFGAWRAITHIASCYQLQLPKCNTAARWLEQTATVTHCFSMESMCYTHTTHTQIWQILRFQGLLNIFMWKKVHKIYWCDNVLIFEVKHNFILSS